MIQVDTGMMSLNLIRFSHNATLLGGVVRAGAHHGTYSSTTPKPSSATILISLSAKHLFRCSRIAQVFPSKAAVHLDSPRTLQFQQHPGSKRTPDHGGSLDGAGGAARAGGSGCSVLRARTSLSGFAAALGKFMRQLGRKWPEVKCSTPACAPLVLPCVLGISLSAFSLCLRVVCNRRFRRP